MQIVTKESNVGGRKISINLETPKEVDIFNTLIGYYPYATMEKLRKEFGNQFPDVTTEEVMEMVKKIGDTLPKH